MLCPVCFKIFEGRTSQCIAGHTICLKCMPKLENECQKCRGPYLGTRNYIVERFAKEFIDIGLAAITLTEAMAPLVNSTANELNERVTQAKLFRWPRGLFACRFLNCGCKLAMCRMANHVRTFHSTNLTEVRAITHKVKVFFVSFLF